MLAKYNIHKVVKEVKKTKWHTAGTTKVELKWSPNYIILLFLLFLWLPHAFFLCSALRLQSQSGCLLLTIVYLFIFSIKRRICRNRNTISVIKQETTPRSLIIQQCWYKSIRVRKFTFFPDF